MEKIINRMRYSTKKAKLVASDQYWDGSNFERGGRNTFLYKTKNGRWFLHKTTLWQGESDDIEPIIDEMDAHYWYEKLPVKEITYKEAFGEEPEEA